MQRLYEQLHTTDDYRLKNQGIDCLGMWRFKLVLPNARVLEFGCGNGLLCKEIASEGFEVTGVDIVEGDYDRTGYEFVRSMDDLQRHYDYALSFDVLEHLEVTEAYKSVHQLCEVADCVILGIACYGPSVIHPTVHTPLWWYDRIRDREVYFHWEILNVFDRYEHESPVILLCGEKR